jgi:hypothetical protein
VVSERLDVALRGVVRSRTSPTRTATLVDVKLVLSAPMHTQTKRSGYVKAQIAFASARMKFIERATSTTGRAPLQVPSAESHDAKTPDVPGRNS